MVDKTTGRCCLTVDRHISVTHGDDVGADPHVKQLPGNVCVCGLYSFTYLSLLFYFILAYAFN